jgi:hypothetical protein
MWCLQTEGKTQMAQRVENRSINDAVELLKENGFDGLADAVTLLLNSAMVAERSEHLGAAPSSPIWRH